MVQWSQQQPQGENSSELNRKEAKKLAKLKAKNEDAILKQKKKEKNTPRKEKAKNAAGKTQCQACKKKCSGEVLRVQDKYFHIDCFKCKVCHNSLAKGGFFCKDGEYLCSNDYQNLHGTRCATCGEYVEGEVVTALGNTYHQRCFTCNRCRQAFPAGERVTFTGKEVLCQKCAHIPLRDSHSVGHSPSDDVTECAGCKDELKEGQALIALDKQWHVWCFKCRACGTVLHGEYMGRDGMPYCEKDYQKQFGVKCAYCKRYIAGKVLQAGDNHHFHPTCARCTKCGDPFGDGEEMYLQGAAIWHPRCGPGPTENGTIINLNGSVAHNGHNLSGTQEMVGFRPDSKTDGELSKDFEHMSSTVSETQFSFRSRTPSFNGSLSSPFNSLPRNKYSSYRTSSPGLILREYNKNSSYGEDITRIYTYSYLAAEPAQGYLRKPIEPYDKPPTSPHFHRPPSTQSRGGSKLQHFQKAGSRSGMKALVESIQCETPRPRSPHMNNEEPIELAHFPAAKPPDPNEKPKIEREDFPAPPYPFTDPERRKRWSDTYKGVPESEDEEDGVDAQAVQDAKLKREEEELSRIATGIGKVFLQNVREREKMRQWKMSHLDPRNASRTPSASKEPTHRLRYESPINASPSRYMDHPRPWGEEEEQDRSSSYRSSTGRSCGTIPSYNVVSSLRSVPKPGYGLKSSTLPAAGRNGGPSGSTVDYPYGLPEKQHSNEFSSGKSDISVGSITDTDRKALNPDLHYSSTYASGFRHHASSYSPHLRRSLPNMAQSSEPPKIYPYHLLLTSNYRLPVDVDRTLLERHLSDAEFEALFQCTRAEFYRLPQWRRNDMKRRIKLF